MTQRTLFAGAAAVALLVAGAAQAQVTAPMETQPIQTRPALGTAQQAVGTGLGEEIEDIEIRTQRELARAEDQARFGTAAVAPGFQGSVALTGSGSWGNTDTADLGIAGRFTYGADPVNHSFSFGVEYGEEDDERSRNRILGVYDLTYDFSPQFYGFGIVRGQYDEFASTNETDIFAGVGPGIRVINTDDVAWRLQAGPGYRYTKNVETGDTEDEFAGIASSRFFYRVTERHVRDQRHRRDLLRHRYAGVERPRAQHAPHRPALGPGEPADGLLDRSGRGTGAPTTTSRWGHHLARAPVAPLVEGMGVVRGLEVQLGRPHPAGPRDSTKPAAG
jgi:hypothetical protein